jgi:CRISPR-associated protein Cmr1
MRRPHADPPALPAATRPEEWTASHQLRSLTPIFGGGSRSKRGDADQPLRTASIRGQLRMWWRSFQQHPTIAELWEAERQLFGGVHGERAVASRVRVLAWAQAEAVKDKPSAFNWALWVMDTHASASQQLFKLKEGSGQLRLSGPKGRAQELERMVWLWLMLGGVGGRSRRGLGALWSDQLPVFASGEQWAKELLACSEGLQPRPWPTLAGLRCLWLQPEPSAEAACGKALEAFKAARGMRDLGPGKSPRFDGSQRIPQIQSQDWGTIRDSGDRHGTYGGYTAAFGLPIQYRSSDDKHFKGTIMVSPAGFSRLPSPVLVRPVPLANKQFLPGLVLLQPWATPALHFKGAQLQGRLNPAGLDLLYAHLKKNGWSSLP